MVHRTIYTNSYCKGSINMELTKSIENLQQILNLPVSVYHQTELVDFYPRNAFFSPDIAYTLLHRAAAESSCSYGFVISEEYIFYDIYLRKP